MCVVSERSIARKSTRFCCPRSELFDGLLEKCLQRILGGTLDTAGFKGLQPLVQISSEYRAYFSCRYSRSRFHFVYCGQ